MRITTDHPGSSHGIPVILDDDGDVMAPAAGIRAARHRLGLSVGRLGEAVGKSGRTVEGWEQGRRLPPAGALYLLARMLDDVGGGSPGG